MTMVSVLRLPSPFARLQTLADLLALARAAEPKVWARVAARIPGLPAPEALRPSLSSGRIDGAAAEILPALELAATLPGEDTEGFVAATALLIADRLRFGAGQDDLFWHIDAHGAQYRTLPDRVRGALLRGIAGLSAQGRVRLEEPPAGSDLVTHSTADVLGRLSALARAAPPEIRAAMSRADMRRAPEAHAVALDALLEQAHPVLPRGPSRWHPGEVVDLTSLFPPARGFAEATALLLIEAITLAADPDMARLAAERAEGLSWRWMQFDRAYTALPGAAGDAVIGGFRHLWETQPGWDPYSSLAPSDVVESGIAIPLPAA
ncbi:MAG: hypothetical protein AAFR47_03665 [Pseudomonadota bacterium]